MATWRKARSSSPSPAGASSVTTSSVATAVSPALIRPADAPSTSRSGLRVVVPGRPVSWNRAYRVSGSRVYLTDEGRTWKNAVRLTALDAANRSGWRPLAGPLVVELWLFLGHEMDVDNALKLTLDGLASALRVDDRRFLPRVMGKSVGPGQPEKVVMVVLNEEV